MTPMEKAIEWAEKAEAEGSIPTESQQRALAMATMWAQVANAQANAGMVDLLNRMEDRMIDGYFERWNLG